MTSIITTSINTLSNTKSVNDYVVEFNQFAAKTADAIIGMGRIVFLAKRNLGNDFESFCTGIRFKQKSSAIRMLEKIGEKAEFLEKYADSLPNTWTTVYRLTQLKNEVLESAIQSGAIHSTMSGIEAGRLLIQENGVPQCSKRNIKQISLATPVAANDNFYELTLRFDGVPDRSKVTNLEIAINGMAATTGNCNVIRSQPLNILMQDQPQAAAV